MPTSGTYTFLSPKSDELITDAYERAGISPVGIVSGEQLYSAQRSINFILSSWMNKPVNNWTLQRSMMPLVSFQSTYQLPANTSDVIQACLRLSTRNLGGTAASSPGGVAANAFDADSTTACTQSGPNGNISYTWTSAYSIELVGIQSNTTTTYTLVFEYSNDGVTWSTALSVAAQTYTIGSISWFTIPALRSGTYFRVRETAGATLNIQELYFNSQINDRILTRYSNVENFQLPQKNMVSTPSSFFVDKQISPTITIWPIPNATYNNLFLLKKVMMEDVGALTDYAAVPPRLLDALCAALAYRLSLKSKDPNIRSNAPQLKMIADEEFNLAYMEDGEDVPLRIYPNYSRSAY